MPFTNALSTLARLESVSFNYKEGYYGGKEDIGLIAEQVAEVDSRLALYGEDGQPLNVNERALISVLIGSVQEQQAQIDELRNEIEKLKAR